MMVSLPSPPNANPPNLKLELGRPLARSVDTGLTDDWDLLVRVNGYGMHLLELTGLVYPA